MKSSSTRIASLRVNRHRGFTLVELLVCITIIIVLAALVFSITGKIRASAQQATAMSSLRQIGIANVAYSSENNGDINVIRDTGEWGSFEGPGSAYASNSFVGRMQPFLFAGIGTKDEKSLKNETYSAFRDLFQTSDLASMAGTPFSGVPIYADGSGIHNPISVNSKLRPVWGKTSPPLRVSSFGSPANVLYLTYGRYYFDLLQGSTYTPMPLPGDRRRTIYYLPNRKAIFCFLDGHIEMLSPPIPERLFQ
jgi:prepilin-type N-terminal cleavage/methylation domain-containing protein